MSFSLNTLSEELLLKVKTGKDKQELIQKLENFNLNLLKEELKDDYLKKAFWINIYNSFFQILRKEKGIDKPNIYRDRLLIIAGQEFSLDDVEHGILRKFRYKYSLGYLSNPFVSNLIKSLAVSKIDYRIHFALNCGAKSCPPIAFYTASKIEEQLETATLSFLEGETEKLEEKKEIHISQLFKWYRADFGGPSGTRDILQDKLKMNIEGYKLIYKEYSWDELLDNYDDANFKT